MNYKKAKRKFFRKRADKWYLFYKGQPILQYDNGMFDILRTDDMYLNMILLIMHKSDTEAFWFAHKLQIRDEYYSLKYGVNNNSCTVTFSPPRSYMVSCNMPKSR